MRGAGRRWRLGLVAAAAGLSIALGACAPDDPLSGWRDAAVEVCESATDDYSELPGIVDPEEGAAASHVALELSQRRLDHILAVDVPDGSEDAVAEFTDALVESQQSLESIASALGAGDFETLQQLSADSLVLQEQTHQAASVLGVEECAPDPG